jgi:hypothetical protein
VLNTDDPTYDGTGFAVETDLATEPEPMHGFPQSLMLRLPPLAALVFEPVGATKEAKPKPAKATRKKPAARRPATSTGS